MNFLALVQRLRQECGITGTGPATVVNQSGEMKRLVDWTAQAWVDVQSLHPDWDWMRASFLFTTTNQQQLYTPAQAGVTNLGMWRRETFRLSTTSQNFGDEMLMSYLDWDVFRNLYIYGRMRTTYQRPTLYSISPQRAIALGGIPDDIGYTVGGDYFTTPVMLAADADIPACPDRWHMIIVYKAMQMYASFESAPEVFNRGLAEYNRMRALMEIDQIGNASFVYGPPLA